MTESFEKGELYKGRYVWEFVKILDNGLPGFLCRGYTVGSRFVSLNEKTTEPIAVWGFESFRPYVA